MKIEFLALLLLSFISSSAYLAAESIPTDNLPIEKEPSTILLSDLDKNIPVNKEQVIVVTSPIVLNDVEHGQLFLTAYDAEHFLYPVKVISIDGWVVTDLVEDALLAPGEHTLIIVPDFDDITPRKVFMDNTWEEKHISFNLLDDQQIAVSARLLDTETLDWTVELYRVEINLEPKVESNQNFVPSYSTSKN